LQNDDGKEKKGFRDLILRERGLKSPALSGLAASFNALAVGFGLEMKFADGKDSSACCRDFEIEARKAFDPAGEHARDRLIKLESLLFDACRDPNLRGKKADALRELMERTLRLLLVKYCVAQCWPGGVEDCINDFENGMLETKPALERLDEFKKWLKNEWKRGWPVGGMFSGLKSEFDLDGDPDDEFDLDLDGEFGDEISRKELDEFSTLYSVMETSVEADGLLEKILAR
jgi:hypothetical protein